MNIVVPPFYKFFYGVDTGAPEGWSGRGGSFFQKGTFLLLLPTSPYPSLTPKQQGTIMGEWTRRLPQDTASSSGLECCGLNPEHGGVNFLGKNVTYPRPGQCLSD